MTNKAASSYISILFIVCCFLVTAPNKKRCAMSRTLPMVYFQCVSRYRDLFTTETKELSWYMATFSFVLIAWLMILEYEMRNSNFFRCGLHGVLKWCKSRAHERTISYSTIDFRHTLTYESTSANLRQQCLTIFFTVRSGFYLQGQGHSQGLYNQNMTVSAISFISSKPASLLQPNRMLWQVIIRKQMCAVKILDSCVQG